VWARRFRRDIRFFHGSKRVDAMSVLVQIAQQIGGRIDLELNRLASNEKRPCA